MLNAFKKLRRKSETQSSNNELSRVLSITSTGSKSRSKSLTRRLSIFSGTSTSEVNSVNSDYQGETYQLARFKSLNYEKFDNEVLTYLKIQGLSAPKILRDEGHLRISVSSSGEDIFLPGLVAFSEEEQQDLDLNSPININAASANTEQSTDNNTTEGLRPAETILRDESHTNAPTSDDSADPISHTFAIIVSLYKPTAVSTITTQLQTTIKILWPKGLPSDKSIKHETFDIGQCNWDLNLGNYNYFVPLSEDAIDDDEDSYNSYENIQLEQLDKARYLTEQRIPPKTYQLKTFDQVIRGGYSNYKKHQDDPFIIGNLQKSANSVSFPPGDYIFLLPVHFPPNIPESLITEKAQVYYNLKTIVVSKVANKNNYDYGDTLINVIRGPPTNGITTADKPIYVNKVWNDSLNYEISFPKKYVTIGSELPIKLKFAPLVKSVSLKRIKINVLEKITYVSKDLRYEYEEDPPYGETYMKANERVIPLLEIRTKTRTSFALKQEIVETRKDNLLSCTTSSSETDHEENDIEDPLIGMLNISSYVPFVKPQKPLRFYEQVNSKFKNPLLPSITNPEKFSKKQISEDLKTKIINQNTKINPVTRLHHEFVEGLFPDSVNNKYIKIEHKLQISLRISKKDPEHDKIHHYEVMIDTPLYLLNSLCVPDSVDLPSYEQTIPTHIENMFENMDIEEDDSVHHLPTFEEATSPMASPYLGPSTTDYPVGGYETINVLSRTSTLGQSASLGYGQIDNLIENEDEFRLEPFHRRESVAKTEILSSFRRMSQANTEPDDDAADSSGVESEVHNSNPPKYNEVISLLSDDESDDPTYTVTAISGEPNDSVDLTEFIR